MEVPIIPNVFQVRKSTHKPTCSTDVASNTVDGNKNWSQMFETAENHKQACMASILYHTDYGELTKICCIVSDLATTNLALASRMVHDEACK